jgi:hypothetical protein
MSTGNSKEICGASIPVEPEVRKTLCPNGIIAPIQKELMDSTLDVTSLPGKYNPSNLNTNRTIMMDQFAEAVGDLITKLSARRAGKSRAHRVTQWRLCIKNALNKIKTAEDLHNAAKEISSMTSETNSTCKLTVLRVEPHVISAHKRMRIIPCYFLTGLHDLRFILL